MREIGDRRNVFEATLSFETVAAKKKTGHFGQPMSSNEFPMRREAPSPGKKLRVNKKGGKARWAWLGFSFLAVHGRQGWGEEEDRWAK